MSKLSLRDDIEPDIGFTSLGSDIQQYSLAMPGMHAWHLKILKSVVYNDIGLLQRILHDEYYLYCSYRSPLQAMLVPQRGSAGGTNIVMLIPQREEMFFPHS